MTGILARAWLLVVLATTFMVLMTKPNLIAAVSRLRTALAMLWSWFGGR